MRTRAVHCCGYSWYHHWVLRVPIRVRCAERAEEYAIRFVRVTLLVVAQVCANVLGEAGAKNEPSPWPTEPTKARVHLMPAVPPEPQSAVARADPCRRCAGRLLIRPHMTAQTGQLHPVLGWLGRRCDHREYTRTHTHTTRV